MSHLLGTSIIGFDRAQPGAKSFTVKDRFTGETLDGTFFAAGLVDVETACSKAQEAFRPYAQLPKERRAEFLRSIADELDLRKDEIVERGHRESALAVARLTGELGRTTGQLRFFAGIIEEGSWADVRIDLAQPDRQPVPKPEIRSMLRPTGPVVVFGASNFPLAFSVAGGDTASALAAGCPVIVKAHSAHPGTSELAGQAILAAAHKTGMPDGVFSMIFGDGSDVGQALVRHPNITGVGFTGSRRGGLALVRTSQERPVPIPVYAEMSAINPVVVLPGVLSEQTETFAKNLAASATLGVGQFCTNPGLVLLVGESNAFVEAFRSAMSGVGACPMLTQGISDSYLAGARKLEDNPAVQTLLSPTQAGAPGVFNVAAAKFVKDPSLQEEVFGPATLLVLCQDEAEATHVLRALEGQLTASLFATDSELAQAQDLLWELERLAGRILVNQFPTGVEVCQAMVHGGPYPATSDQRYTSVGGRAILRWVRPVAYQNLPKDLLPTELIN